MTELRRDQLRRDIARYVTGFVLCLLMTVVAYAIVVNELLTVDWTVAVLAILALLQVILQLVFFLKLGHEVGTKWRVISFISMAAVLFIIVAGSIWIMYHLDYNMMTMPHEEMMERMERESGF